MNTSNIISTAGESLATVLAVIMNAIMAVALGVAALTLLAG